MRIKLFILVILLEIASNSSAQNSLVIQGMVTDTTLLPLNKAHALDLNSRAGAITSSFGSFKLNVPKDTTTLKISHVGFHTLYKKIDRDLINSAFTDTLYLAFTLNPKTQELGVVEIKDEKIQHISGRYRKTILDYDFVDQDILLLANYQKKHRLELITENATGISSLRLPFRPKKLFRDCFGNLHVLSEDSVYQVAIQAQNVSLLKGYSIKVFGDFLENCEVASHDRLFFREFGARNKSISYYSIHKESKSKNLLVTVRDKAAELFAMDYPSLEEIEAYERGEYVPGMGDRLCSILSSRVLFDLKIFVKMVTQPIYNPMLLLKDSLFVFDHVKDSCYVYNKQGEQFRQFPITHHQNKGWREMLYVGQDHSTVYAKIRKGEMVYLHQLDLLNGKVIKTIKIEDHPLPEKIKIRDGFVYYLYQDRFNPVDQQLYKQRME